MATTTNYGWTTPDDTDLVKDGAAAIRTLGSSVDTTTKDLNPSTTLGDVEYRSATANTNTRLPIGTSGQVLTVSGGVPAWTTPAATGAWTLLTTTSLSGTSTTVSSINQTYTDLVVVIQGITASGFYSDMNFGMNGTNSGQSTRSWVTGSMTSSGVTGGAFTGMSNNINQQNASTDNCYIVTIPFYSSTTIRKVANFNAYWTSASGELVTANGTFANNSTGAVTSFRLQMDGSKTFSSGTILTYGVK
jgi:hypothetical protein